jgi:hypothetical protein
MEVTNNKIEAKGSGNFSDVQIPRLKSEPSDIKVGSGNQFVFYRFSLVMLPLLLQLGGIDPLFQESFQAP